MAAAANATGKGLDVLIACHIRLEHEPLFLKKKINNDNNTNGNNDFVVVDDYVIELSNKNTDLEINILKQFNIKSLDYFDTNCKKGYKGEYITDKKAGKSGQNYFGHMKKFDKIFTICCPVYEFIKMLKTVEGYNNYNNMLQKFYSGDVSVPIFDIFSIIENLSLGGQLYIDILDDKIILEPSDLNKIKTNLNKKTNVDLKLLDYDSFMSSKDNFYINKGSVKEHKILVITKKPQLGGDMNLYSPNRIGKKPRVITGFANSKIAKKTLKNIKKYDMNYQKQVVITMYNRAKFHPHRTKLMENAMKIFSDWMKKNNIKISRTLKK